MSIAIGAVIGEALDLDRRISALGSWIETKCQKNKKPVGGTVSAAEGFASTSLLFCVGTVAIVGSLQSGMTGNHEMLFTKSILDFICAIIFASSLGYGVLFSSVFILIYQGSITLLAQVIAPYLGDAMVAEMTCVGSILIIGLGLNMLNVTKIKVMKYVSAIFLPSLFCLFL